MPTASNRIVRTRKSCDALISKSAANLKSDLRSILCFCVAIGVLGNAGLARALDATRPTANFPLAAASTLPKEARETLALIRKGGPYPYAKDGSIFSNRERILPKESRGFYREFTVKTPHARDRGARRIVCGGAPVKQQPQVLEPCYYTDDHYASFKKIKE